MKDKIDFINMNGKLDHKEIYNLFKTSSSKLNKEISEKIGNYKYNMDFFGFYSNTNIKNLFYILELKLSENNEEFFSSFESDTEQYISCISHIFLSKILFLKIHEILTNIMISAKNHLAKLNIGKIVENDSPDYSLLSLESLLKNSEKNSKNCLIFPSVICNNISTSDDTPKNSFFQKYSRNHKIDDSSNDSRESSIFEPQTPRFELEIEEEFEKQEKRNSSIKNITQDNSFIQKDSVLTLSKYAFAEEPLTLQNFGLTLIKSPVKPNLINNSPKEMITQIENCNKNGNERSLSSESERVITTNNKIDRYKKLLEMINKMYKTGLINSEEKVKLKLLMIDKSKKIEDLYYNLFTYPKNDKNVLINEIKKIMN